MHRLTVYAKTSKQGLLYHKTFDMSSLFLFEVKDQCQF